MIKKALVLSLLVIVFFPEVALANEPTIVTGTKDLLNALMNWLLGLIPLGAASVLAWHAFAKQLNEGDGAKVSQHNQAMKNTLISAAIGVTAAGTVKAILAFYGG